MLERLKSQYNELGEQIEDIFMNPDNFLSDEQIEVLTQRYNRMNTIMDDRRKVIDGISDLLLQQYSRDCHQSH